jgi:hypothetical protein
VTRPPMSAAFPSPPTACKREPTAAACFSGL